MTSSQRLLAGGQKNLRAVNSINNDARVPACVAAPRGTGAGQGPTGEPLPKRRADRTGTARTDRSAPRAGEGEGGEALDASHHEKKVLSDDPAAFPSKNEHHNDVEFFPRCTR